MRVIWEGRQGAGFIRISEQCLAIGFWRLEGFNENGKPLSTLGALPAKEE